MAKIPTPRSWNQILGDMIDAFLSRYGLKALKVGSPVLSIMESAAQSDLRSSQDIFDLLNSNTLDRANGLALDRIGRDEGLVRKTERAASGLVTVGDSRYTKIASKVYQGQPAPIVGSVKLYVTDASSFPATGQLYVGRGTPNYEGPLSYTSKVNNGTYWTLTLSSPTRRFHNLSENVILAQGGNRLIPAGSLIQTPQGNNTDAVQFATLFEASIPDGEVEVLGVQVLAQTAGLRTNVPAGAISAFVTVPFSGATVTNPLPFTNGRAAENDKTFRERIRNARQSRTKGTSLAITTGLQDLVAQDENKRIASSSVVAREGAPTTVYIDDGTGYEESSSGVALESLLASAIGGEKYFQVQNRPLAKASLTTTATAPFKLEDASRLAIAVGGVVSEHTFSAAEFKNIANATAYEIAASINADSNLTWSAATSDGGTTVRIFAKGDENEDVQVVAASFSDANAVLLLPTELRQTLWLARNDVLLSKDGEEAVLNSNPVAEWGSFSSGETLTLSIDGTSSTTYTFSDQDFVDAKSGFTTVGQNTPAAWVAVLNYKIPGITATVAEGLVVISSNAGRTSRAKLSITGGSLVSKRFISASSASGRDRDYTLNRNTGQIRLLSPLAAGDSLSAGTTHSRAFIESGSIGVLTVSSQADLYFVLDGSAQIVPAGSLVGTQIQFTDYAGNTRPGIKQVQVVASSGTPFSNVRAGDWVIAQDGAINQASNTGFWRVTFASGNVFEIERSSYVAETVTLTAPDGLVFVRTDKQIQWVGVDPGSYTASSLADLISSKLVGGVAEVYKTSRVRVRTDSFDGDIALVANWGEAKQFSLPVSSAVRTESPHVAAIRSGNSEAGTPSFVFHSTDSVSNPITFVPTNDISDIDNGNVLVFIKTPDYSTTDGYGASSAFGNNNGMRSSIAGIFSGQIQIRNGPSMELLPDERFYAAAPFAIGPSDSLVVVVDQDDISHRYSVPFWRKLKPASSTYGQTVALKDADNGNVTLATAFGLGFDFTDFAIHMAARVITDSTDSTKSLLWRYKRLGADGELARVRYVYPASPSSALTVTTDNLSSTTTDITVALPSGAAKTGINVRPGTQVGLTATTSGGGTVLTYMLGAAIGSATRATGTVTLTLTLPSGVTDHGLTTGNSVYVQSANGSFPSGLKSITRIDATHVSYVEIGSDATAASIGTVSFDTSEATLAALSPSLAVGDILQIQTSSSLPAAWEKTIRVSAFGAQYVQGTFYGTFSGALSSVPTWSVLGDASAILIYPLANNSASAISSAVNAVAVSPVKTTLLGTGAGLITQSSDEAAGAANTWNQLTDGLNWVQAVTYPATNADDYQITFKKVITPGLVSNSDWLNEEVRIVPNQAATITRWLNSPAVSGLGNACSIAAAEDHGKVEISTLTTGSSGAVQVQGGSATEGTAAVNGSAVAAGSVAVVTVAASEGSTFTADMWVRAQNAVPMPKSVFTSSTSLTSIATNGTLIVTTTPVWTYANGGPITGKTWQVSIQGRFVAFNYSIDTYGSGPSVAGVAQGSFVRIQSTALNALNLGIFRVVNVSSTTRDITIWIENPNAVAEIGLADLSFFTADSVMPGDTLHIGTDLWNAANRGTWTVQYVGGTTSGTQFADRYTLKLDTSSKAMTAVTGPVVLGSSAPLVQVVDSEPVSLVKKVISIIPNQTDPTFLDIKLTPGAQLALMSEAAGTVLQPLDRLAFPQDVVVGADGYRKNAGLIAEANKVLYGDTRDPATYPGVIASGAKVNISAPLIKRIQVALELGITGSAADIKNKVQSAVAAVINKSPIGQPIAISTIITAAGKVSGVASVAVISPTYNGANAFITVQPDEKPLVLDLASDVTVTFA
jgi:uncharacterized phage protein gp47/JayE